MAHSYTNLLYHIVFGTKGREPWLRKAILADVLNFLGGGIKEQGGICLEINGMPDHVHILAKLRPDHSVSDILRDIKARSSGWIHSTYADLACFAWQSGYGAFSVSHSQRDNVGEYIRNQEEHHRDKPFAREFIQLLIAHEVEFDERYLWD
jgi:REP-associated tyrosine transposase